MRWILVLPLLAFGCEPLLESPHPPPADRDPMSPKAGADAGGTTSTLGPSPPVTLDVGGAGVTPAAAPDWCAVAAEQGAVFCEVDQRELEFCVVASSNGGTGGVHDAGAAGGTGGAGAGEGGDGGGRSEGELSLPGGAGADGASGASAPGVSGGEGGAHATEGGVSESAGGAIEAPNSGCPLPDYPPEWVHELVVQCYAHCAVRLVRSSHRLDGACCYRAYNVYAGR